MGIQRERRDVVKSYENEQEDKTDLNGVQNESKIEFGEFLILIQEQHNRKKGKRGQIRPKRAPRRVL